MRIAAALLLAAAALAALPGAAHAAWGSAGNSKDRVLLGDVKTLTLRVGAYTAGRRSAALPQLACVGGDACRDYSPEVVQCTNVGFDGKDYSWRCEAELPSLYRFGTTDVSCEGYDYPDDPYILAGSCSLMYTLSLTEEGRRAKGGYTQQQQQQQAHVYPSASGHSDGWSSLISVLFLFGLVYLFFKCAAAPAVGPGGSYPGSGPGGANYHPYPEPGCDPNPPMPPSSGPGFWTGAGVGGTLGYMFGRQAGQNTFYAPAQPAGFHPFQPAFHSAQASAPAPPPSTRQATGFGETRRR